MNTSTIKFGTLLIASALALSLQAQTTFEATTNTRTDVADNWSNGLPTSTSIGTIAIDATRGDLVVNDAGDVTVNHTAGTIAQAGGNRNITNTGDGALIWNMSGGSFTITDNAARSLFFGNATTHTTIVNMSSGSSSITGDGPGSALYVRGVSSVLNMSNGSMNIASFLVDSGGTFNMSGGAFTGELSLTNTANLTGGTWSQTAALSGVAATTVLNIGGDFSITSRPAATALFPTMTGATFNFLDTWTGSIVASTENDRTSWVSMLETTGATWNSNTITNANFDDNFSVTGTGALTVIPEPSTLALLGIALGSVFFFRRRK